MNNTNLPEDFDWGFYLNNNPDLTKAGITTKKGAVKHYLKHGQYENRIYRNIIEVKKDSNFESFINICYDLIKFLPNTFPIINKNSYKKSLLVETRELKHNEFVIKNTIQKLGDGWGHIIYCHKNNLEQIKKICDDISSDIEIRLLDFELTRNSYNNLLLDLSFWEKINCDKVLIYQTDTFIDKNFDDDFLNWDYIGGPWTDSNFYNQLKNNLSLDNVLNIGNGGLSIRDIQKTKDCIKNEDFIKKHINKNNMDKSLDKLPEDILFSIYFQDKKIPNVIDAKKFSSEQGYNKESFGYHKPWNFMTYYEMLTAFHKVKININIHQLCYNESILLEFSHNFYKKRFPNAKFILHDNQSTDNSRELALKLGYEVRTFDTNNQMDEMSQTILRNNCWKNDEVDWVMVLDMDELIDIDEQDLINEQHLNNTIIKTKAFHMINLEDNLSNLNDIKYGFRDDAKNDNYDKCLIFNKKYIEDMGWSVGSHNCNPKGSLVNYTNKKYNLLHYKFLSKDYVISRYKNLLERQSEKNLEKNWCHHYNLNELQMVNLYDESLKKPLQDLTIHNLSKKICFTISTPDRLPQSKTLGDSFINNNPNYEFIIISVGEIPKNYDAGYKTIYFKDIFVPNIENKINKYPISNLCFMLKPFVLSHFLKYSECDSIIYLDSDIFVFNEFYEVEKSLIDYDIILTPHAVNSNTSENDFQLLQTGLFNAGFLALKNTNNSLNFLKWWSEKLEKYCKIDYSLGLFDDQKWLDLCVVFFDRVKIIKDEGYNVAYWNLKSRNMIKENDNYKVNDNKKLIFYHFAGYEFNNEITKFKNNLSSDIKNKIQELFDFYKEKVNLNR